MKDSKHDGTCAFNQMHQQYPHTRSTWCVNWKPLGTDPSAAAGSERPKSVELVGNRAPTPDEIKRGLELEPLAQECLARNKSAAAGSEREAFEKFRKKRKRLGYFADAESFSAGWQAARATAPAPPSRECPLGWAEHKTVWDTTLGRYRCIICEPDRTEGE